MRFGKQNSPKLRGLSGSSSSCGAAVRAGTSTGQSHTQTLSRRAPLIALHRIASHRISQRRSSLSISLNEAAAGEHRVILEA